MADIHQQGAHSQGYGRNDFLRGFTWEGEEVFIFQFRLYALAS